MKEKKQLRSYLQARGIKYNPHKKTWQCPNPAHVDAEPSAVLYENPAADTLWCPVCAESWSIFEVAGLLNGLTEFKDKLKSVRETLGITGTDKPAPKSESVPLDREQARTVYTREKILSIYKMSKRGTLNMDAVQIVKSWPYIINDKVHGLDVRFEDGSGDKNVIMFWYNGRSLKTAGAPVLIYGLDDALKSDKPVLIHEGAKCAELAGALTEFVSVSWSGGWGKAHLIDWTVFNGRDVFIFPDDDEPGQKAAAAIKKQLPHARIVEPLTASRQIKPQGADIEEALRVMTPDELTAYILKTGTPEMGLSEPATAPLAETKPDSPSESDRPISGVPFKILGCADGEAHFIDQWGYYQHYKLSQLTKNRLNELASLNFWLIEYGTGRKGYDAEQAIDFIISASKQLEFDTDRLRGRGAWKDEDGRICYHDGRKTYGEKSPRAIYLKLPRKEIGINGPQADENLLLSVRDLIFTLSFETKTDAVRTMGWAALAPFCGALEYRPTLMLTGHSSTGKTKVQKLFIEKLSNFLHLDLRTSSEAGVRRSIGKDSRVVFFDEAGKENDKMKMNFDSIMSFIRSNYSEESPESVKASLNDNGVVRAKMNSMFGFATTDPTIENVQDDNRILRVNFVKPKHTAAEWQFIEAEIRRILNKENCDKIRSLVWTRLKTITAMTERIVQIARDKTKRDYRSSYADMLLASAYMVVWCNTPEPTEEQIKQMLDKYYSLQEVHENRDESVEVVNRIMDEIIEVIHEQKREKLTIQEAISRVFYKNYIDEDGFSHAVDMPTRGNYVRFLSMYGIKLVGDGVHFANKNHMIKKITGLSDGYEKLLSRHPGSVVCKNPVTYSGGVSKRGTLIKGLIPERDGEVMEFV